MTAKHGANSPEIERFASRRYQGWLAAALLSLFFFLPVLEDSSFGILMLVLLGNLIVIAGLYAVSWNNRRLAVGLLLALPNIVTSWSYYFHNTLEVGVVLTCSMIVFFAYTIATILQRIFRANRIGVDELFGALNVYILIGVSFGLLFCLMEALNPNSFNFGDLPRHPSSLVYYSFSTLGTLGIGDVRPILPYARSLSIVEMLVGLFFVAVSVGKLVAIFRLESTHGSRSISAKPPFERSMRILTRLPLWVFVLMVAVANVIASLIDERLQLPLFLDTWATSAGVILGGLWVGLGGGVLYNLIMAAFFWGPDSWAWAFNSALVALMTRVFWDRGLIDINRPFALIGCGLIIAFANTILGTVVLHFSGLSRNLSTMSLHNEILHQTGSIFAADFGQQLAMESMDKVVSIVITAVVVFSVHELRRPQTKIEVLEEQASLN